MTDATEMETRRLLLRPLQVSDAARTQELFPVWDVVRFLNPVVPWPYPPDGALRYYRDVALPAMEDGREWHWTLRLKEAPEAHIGAVCLVRDSPVDHRGFWLGLPWHGQGLMTEAAVAVMNFWFEVLERPVLRTSKAALNTGSVRVSERTGMRFVGVEERAYVGGRSTAQMWEMTREEWVSKRADLRSMAGLRR